ncbi:MAG: hypothetical protein AUG44_26585 [Actinobacteria bacterium 13_1_20CM_3_71_11]|nr:MAG: hypothetical protein AUG44_26585 [Actinobacteria bacterium 13_1_20CM_3_71_11]
MAIVDTARSIAEDVFRPTAGAVDRADRVPAGLAGGCLATTFVWLQHFSALRAAQGSRWYRPLARGQLRAGVVQAALRPGPPSVRARRVAGGYVFDGAAPWVTGWDLVDVLHAAARDEDGTVVWALLEAVAGDALTVELLDLVAVRASRTVVVRFDGYFVPDERVTRIHPYAEWAARDAANLRLNGSLALGVTARCAALLDSVPLWEALDGCRSALDAGTPGIAEARAAASALAARAAAALATAHGARAVLRGSDAERSTREALFLLVFGSRPAIKAALTGRLLS